MCVQCTLWLWDENPLPCHSLLYTHNCLYYILSFCFFVYSLFVYLYIILYYMCPVLLLSFCCTIELMSRKQIPRMCKHSWPIKLILILKHRSCWVKVRAQERAVLNATTADLEHSFRERFVYIFFSGGPLSALTCCVNARLLSAIKKISPLIYSQSWVGSWVYTTQAMMTFTLIF